MVTTVLFVTTIRHMDIARIARFMKPMPKPRKSDHSRIKVKAVEPKKEPLGKRKKRVEKQLEAMVKMLIAWRDGQECVMKGRGKCGNGLMWNHLVSQNSSAWLKYDLGNVFWGCGVHNLQDYRGSTVMPAWFASKFGTPALDTMDLTRDMHVGDKHSLSELEAMLAHYEELYQNRYTVNLDTESLVKAGYYGDIVKHTYVRAAHAAESE